MKKTITLLSILFAATLTNCSKKDPEPKLFSVENPQQTLHYDSEVTLILKEGNGIADASKFDWTSSDEKVATISNGKVVARKIGTINVDATGKDGNGGVRGFPVNIVPYYETYKKPFLDFGKSKDAIKTFETRKLYAETENFIAYEGENSKIDYIGYSFTNGKLTGTGVIFKSTSTIVNEVGTYLKERYPDNGVVDGEIIFLDDARKYGIFLTVGSAGLMAVYAEYNSSVTRQVAGNEINKQDFINAYKKFKESIPN